MINVLHLIWAKGKWSWGVVYGAVQKELAGQYNFEDIEFISYLEDTYRSDDYYYFCQNITQFASLPVHVRCRTIIRLGGNMNFSGTGNATVDGFIAQMGKCGAVIATNNYLYKIGMLSNPNTYLIPNGIDTSVWCPDLFKKFRKSAPIVGFIGNVRTPVKAKYKGYGLVVNACQELGLPLKQALYKESQIPHKKMKSLFWDKVDIFVLPTDGEGSSNSIMEALACGVPVITTRTAGYHGENLTDRHNVLFVEKNVESIKSAIKKLMRNEQFYKKISENGRQFAIEHHDIKKIADMYREVFEKHFK